MSKKVSVKRTFLSVGTKEHIMNNPPWETSKGTNSNKGWVSLWYITVIKRIFTVCQGRFWCGRIRFAFLRIEDNKKQQKFHREVLPWSFVWLLDGVGCHHPWRLITRRLPSCCDGFRRECGNVIFYIMERKLPRGLESIYSQSKRKSFSCDIILLKKYYKSINHFL